MRSIRGVLTDIDGVLTVSWQPLPRAVAAMHRLRADAVLLAWSPIPPPAPGPRSPYAGRGQAFNQAFGHLQHGARPVAMDRGPYWRTSDDLQLDTGAFLAGLEQAAATQADVIGKPAPAFFATALANLGAGPAAAIMVGDDIEADVLATQRQGLTGVLVKTGKCLPRTRRAASGTSCITQGHPQRRQQHPTLPMSGSCRAV
jgi:ribonucleotide monophosphatase NagD (HAD superfamily)